jgi:hypothetical protein
LIAFLLLVVIAAPLIPSRYAESEEDGGAILQQETWSSLWEGDGVSPPSSEGWNVRHWGSVSLTPGISDGETVAIVDDSDNSQGGWMQRFIDFEPPFKIAARGRYDPLTMRIGDAKIPHVYTGTHHLGADYYPSYIRILGVPTFDIPTLQGVWHNVTFDVRAPLDVDVYVDGIFVRNIEMEPADSIIFDQTRCKPAITTLETTIPGTPVAMVDYIRTTLPSINEGSPKNCERSPPLVSVALDDGVNPPSADLYVTEESARVWLNATIDDSSTGGSAIWSANYTDGPANWPGAALPAEDGSYDSPVEDVTTSFDVGTLSLGDHVYCVYGRDYLGNWDRGGSCATLHVLPPMPPRIYGLTLDDGVHPPSQSLEVVSGATSTVRLNATIDDYATGGSDIAAANFTIGTQNWPGTGMAAIDGAFDTPMERVTSVLAVGPFGLGNRTLCVYARDSFGMENLTGSCAFLSVVQNVIHSVVEAIAPYWWNHSAMITATTVDGILPVVSVELYYDYSADNASWSGWESWGTAISKPWNWTFPFPRGEGHYAFYSVANDTLGTGEPPPSVPDALAAFDRTPPTTVLSIGEPKCLVGGNFVRSSTPLTLQAVDGGTSPVGVNVTRYRVDGGDWNDYSNPFTLTGEGTRTVEYYSLDLLTNEEANHSIHVVVDDTPPATALSAGVPKYTIGGLYVKSSTPLTLSTIDGGVGRNSTFYRLWGGSWSQWRDYSTSFSLAGRDGTWYVEYLSFDYLGNMESIRNETLILDDTPPVTTISPAIGPYITATVFNLTAADAGCGVSVTRYRIDAGGWLGYSGGFNLAVGEHDIFYYSKDNIDNTETEKTLHAIVQEAPLPPGIDVRMNYKPLVALIFALILTVIGLWTSKKRPWKGGDGKMAVLKAFAVTSLPFVTAEAITGIVSHLTGQLSIPPIIGAGTAVDLTILLLGILFPLIRFAHKSTKK